VYRDGLLLAAASILVAGLWIASLFAAPSSPLVYSRFLTLFGIALFTAWSTAWLFGALLAVHGFAGLCYSSRKLRRR